MKRRTKVVLLIAGLAITAVGATVVGLTEVLAKVVDQNHYCETGYSNTLAGCRYGLHRMVSRQGTPIFTTIDSPAGIPEDWGPPFELISSEFTLWAIAGCPENAFARRLLCPTGSVASPAPTSNDDLAVGLPLPKPWLLRTAHNSPAIEALHVETLLDLATVLQFYRDELGKRGWTETSDAAVASDRAVITFATTDGPALLRLTRQADRTVADLSRRKPASAKDHLLPKSGQARLKLGNTSDQDAVVTINEQTIKLSAKAGSDFTEGSATSSKKSPDNSDLDLPPGKYTVTLKTASGATQTRAIDLVADETVGLLVGPDAVPLPMRLY